MWDTENSRRGPSPLLGPPFVVPGVVIKRFRSPSAVWAGHPGPSGSSRGVVGGQLVDCLTVYLLPKVIQRVVPGLGTVVAQWPSKLGKIVGLREQVRKPELLYIRARHRHSYPTEGIRTPGLCLRRAALYPTELRAP